MDNIFIYLLLVVATILLFVAAITNAAAKYLLSEDHKDDYIKNKTFDKEDTNNNYIGQINNYNLSVNELMMHHQSMVKNINKHRTIILSIIIAVSLLISVAIVTRLMLGIGASFAGRAELLDLTRDSQFWLTSIGVGAVVQALAVTLLYSLRSFSKHSIESFSSLDRIYGARIAEEIIFSKKIDDIEILREQERARLEIIKGLFGRALPMNQTANEDKTFYDAIIDEIKKKRQSPEQNG